MSQFELTRDVCTDEEYRAIEYSFTKDTTDADFIWWVADVTEFRLKHTVLEAWGAYFKKHVKSWVRFVQNPLFEHTASHLVLITGCVHSYDWAMAVVEKPGVYTLKIKIDDEISTELRRDGYHLPFQVTHRPTSKDLPFLRVTTKQWEHAKSTDGQGPRPIFTRGIKLEKILSVPARIVAAAEPRDPGSKRDSEDQNPWGQCTGQTTYRCGYPCLTISNEEHDVSITLSSQLVKI